MHSKCAFSGKQSVYLQGGGEIHVFVIFPHLYKPSKIVKCLICVMVCAHTIDNSSGMYIWNTHVEKNGHLKQSLITIHAF